MKVHDRAAWAAIATILLAVFVPFGAAEFGEAAMWIAAIGSGLVLIGVLAGGGWTVICGTTMFAFASMAAMADRPALPSMAVHALTASICLAVLTGTDVSFQGRRQARISSEVLIGRLRANALVALAGLASSVSVLALVLLIEWPGWILPLPLLLLAGASIGLSRQLIGHRKRWEEQHPSARTRF